VRLSLVPFRQTNDIRRCYGLVSAALTLRWTYPLNLRAVDQGRRQCSLASILAAGWPQPRRSPSVWRLPGLPACCPSPNRHVDCAASRCQSAGVCVPTLWLHYRAPGGADKPATKYYCPDIVCRMPVRTSGLRFNQSDFDNDAHLVFSRPQLNRSVYMRPPCGRANSSRGAAEAIAVCPRL